MAALSFTKSALANFRQTASLVPSSRRLARAMVEPVIGIEPQVVLEFGPGTGVMTRELLRCMPPGSVLLAFEINSEFVKHLRESIKDDRLVVVSSGAERAGLELERRGITKVDAVVSSLSLGMISPDLASSIFRGIEPYLRDDTPVTQFQYVYRLRMDGRRPVRFDAGALLRRHFARVHSSTVWLNFPPAVVITCAGSLMFRDRLVGSGPAGERGAGGPSLPRPPVTA